MQKRYKNVFMFMPVAIITGINLLHVPALTIATFQGLILALAFVWISSTARKHGFSGSLNAFCFVAALIIIVLMVMQYEITPFVRELASAMAFFGSLYFVIRGFLNGRGKRNV